MVDSGFRGGGGILSLFTLVVTLSTVDAGPLLGATADLADSDSRAIDNLRSDDFQGVLLNTKREVFDDSPDIHDQGLRRNLRDLETAAKGRGTDAEGQRRYDASRLTDQHGHGSAGSIAPVVRVNWNEALNKTQVGKLQQILATAFGLPLEQITATEPQMGGKMKFALKNSSGQPLLVSADDLTERLSRAGLDQHLPEWKLASIGSKEIVVEPMPRHWSFWTWPYLPYVFAGAGILILVIIIILVICCIYHRRKKSVSLNTTPESTSFSTPQKQVCLMPAAKPDLINNTTAVQPELAFSYLDKGCMTPVQTPPMRLKAKGLLERRGSNASLTLELTPSPGTPAWGSPPRECSVEEYLMSAGNRLSRKQLRNSLKNLKSLYEEFWEIPMNHPDRVEVAGSGTKNRYRTIIPNEYTRVLLPEIDGDPFSSYINANYIRGYAGEAQAYIATQGAMAHTVNDFWRMVWNERSPVIVMITKLSEKNKTKCELYLPQKQGTYGGISVTVTSISEKNGYTLRRLNVKYLSEEREVLHYWYTSWPDHKAPSTAKQLLELAKEVEVVRFDPEKGVPLGPVIVHCSAGIGRTGCFIATSIGMRQLNEEHNVDILGIVCNMRLDRGGMVQTNEQYEFVHRALCLYEKELPECLSASS